MPAPTSHRGKRSIPLAPARRKRNPLVNAREGDRFSFKAILDTGHAVYNRRKARPEFLDTWILAADRLIERVALRRQKPRLPLGDTRTRNREISIAWEADRSSGSLTGEEREFAVSR